MHKNIATRFFLSFIIFILVSCSSPTPEVVPPTQTDIPASTEAPPTETPASTESPTDTPILEPAEERPQYVMDVGLNYSNKSALVNQTITYPNWTGETLLSLILAVEPNLWSGGFSLNSLAVDNQSITNYVLEPLSQRLEIPLPQPLEPGKTITITIAYGLILPQMQAYSNPNEVRYRVCAVFIWIFIPIKTNF